MKRLFIFATLALVCCLGCNKEVDSPEVPQAGKAGTHEVILTAGLESEADAVKGTFVNDKTFQWQKGDEIGVYMYSTTLQNVPGSYGVEGQYGPWIAPFTLKGNGGSAEGIFSRVLNDELGEDFGNVAIYPYNSGSKYTYADDDTKGTLTFNLPAYYKDLDNLDMVRMPMVAVLDMSSAESKTNFTLQHVGGAVKMTLNNVPAKAKYFKLWAVDKNISGDFTINLSDVGTGVLQGNGSGNGNTVELQLKESKARETLDVYFPVPAGTYKLGIGVYGDGIVYLEKESTKDNTIGRGQILRMPAVDIPAPNLGAYDPNLNNPLKASGLTYQVNVYSFADSDGDGVGDFRGILNHLDYFDKLGVTALWLSPCQKAQSYHGYDVTDYVELNPLYGSEEDFQTLIRMAHAHNIRIYMDYVINHTGDQHIWFQDVKANGPSSEYWNYYAVSADPYNDVHSGNIPQIPSYWDVDYMNDNRWWPFIYGAGQNERRYAVDLDWTNASAPAITVSETSEAVTSGGTYNNPARYLFWGDGTYTQFADNGSNKYRLVLDYQSSWGCLVRTTADNSDWSSGTKWGFASGKDQLQPGVSHTLTSTDSNNILMPDGTLYFYYSAFSTGMMPDLNYGHSDECEQSPAFQAIVSSVRKWLTMGLDGLRLDAVKHIYGDESGGDGSENREFWQKFYQSVNAIYQDDTIANARVHSLSGTSDENIFMVGEVLDGEENCRPFYGGLPAIFEFQFWWDLKTALNSENKGNFVSGLCDRYYRHLEERENAGQQEPAISTPKLSNHDEDRTATDLGKYMPKIRLAATVLLTAPGRPFIYQGEELGYWGTGANGDEYRRAPILWTSDISSAAVGDAVHGLGLSGKVDYNMLTPAISVESQAADDESLLMLYRRFAYARNTNKAMANGKPEYDNKTADNASIMAWYMHQVDGNKVCLVMHNISSSTQSVQRWDDDNVSDDTILVASDPMQFSNENGKWVIMPPYSSVVFALN